MYLYKHKNNDIIDDNKIFFDDFFASDLTIFADTEDKLSIKVIVDEVKNDLFHVPKNFSLNKQTEKYTVTLKTEDVVAYQIDENTKCCFVDDNLYCQLINFKADKTGLTVCDVVFDDE